MGSSRRTSLNVKMLKLEEEDQRRELTVLDRSHMKNMRHNNRNLIAYGNSPGMRVNTRYLNSTKDISMQRSFLHPSQMNTHMRIHTHSTYDYLMCILVFDNASIVQRLLPGSLRPGERKENAAVNTRNKHDKP